MRYYRKPDTNATRSKLPFLSAHPLHNSHILGQRRNDSVPVIYGYRLPYVEQETPLELQCKRAMLSLVLFKPFRELEDLIGVSASNDDVWLQAYSRWEVTRSAFVQTIMNNMVDYYSSASHAKMKSDNASLSCVEQQYNDGSDNDSTDDDSADVFCDDTCSYSENEYIECPDQDIDDWDVVVGGVHTPESCCLNPSLYITAGQPEERIGSIIHSFNEFGLLNSIALETATHASAPAVLDSFPSVRDMREWVRDPSTDNAVIRSTAVPNGKDRDTEITEVLNGALEQRSMNWDPSTIFMRRAPEDVKQFATVAEISRLFTLNEKQHYALKAIGSALLRRWKNAESLAYLDKNLSEALRSDQLLFFLGGEGGTGKSRVIEAVEALCSSWERSDSLVKTALTGKAATLIAGITLASFLLQLRRRNCAEMVINIAVVIIDEVSMMKKAQLVQLDKLLRVAKRVPDVLFGGVHVILVGDFLQLPPVGAGPLYRNPTSRRNASVTTRATSFGDLFKQWTYLRSRYAFVKTQSGGKGCHQARLGIWTSEFVDIISSRLIKAETIMEQSGIDGSEPPTFVTPDNSTRLAINNLFTTTVIRIACVVLHKEKLVKMLCRTCVERGVDVCVDTDVCKRAASPRQHVVAS